VRVTVKIEEREQTHPKEENVEGSDSVLAVESELLEFGGFRNSWKVADMIAIVIVICLEFYVSHHTEPPCNPASLYITRQARCTSLIENRVVT
jgi:hypothetical protein